ncbi:MAG: hypothetical protein CSB16_02815 [Clostridiales bacterium]|nr:MAG: hypothetical protein CSB16_02815 [Clostridiales bacterium]
MLQKNEKKSNKNLSINLYWSVIYIIIIWLMAIVALIFSTELGALFFVMAIISLIIFIVSTLFFKRSINNNLINYALDVSNVQKDYIENLVLPIVIVDTVGEIRWHNNSFGNILDTIPEELRSNKAVGKNIHSFISELSYEDFPAEIEGEISKNIEVLEKNYRVVITISKLNKSSDELNLLREDEEETVLYSLSFYDVTKENLLARKLDDQKRSLLMVCLKSMSEINIYYCSIKSTMVDL